MSSNSLQNHSPQKKIKIEARVRRLLELDKILARLQDAASTELGRSLAAKLLPNADEAAVRGAQSQTSEARRFLESGKSPVLGGARDVSAALQRAAIGSTLEPSDLLEITRLAEVSRRLQNLIQSTCKESSADFPLLRADAEQIVPHSALENAINSAIDEASGELKDDASLELLRARRNIRQTQANIQERLRKMLSDPNVQPLLQDAFVTVRDGRYCLPVKAESRSRVPGIVHDRSGSGAAFFVEPQAVVEMNNRLRELHLEEREARRAILQALSAQVGGARADLETSLHAVARLDFAFAKGRLSLSMQAREPQIEASADESTCKYFLLGACHPLVEHCVPNDIYLGDEFDALLITGPNTGGKTVVLKTLGLLTLMTMCGLHIPVRGPSRLGLPRAIFADIGDEQSIEQSLSTFSSHMKNIIAILEQARGGDLVLFDEIGAGTDPDEGAAIAKAVLRNLQRRGVRILATTHYGELKQFALGAERFENASVEFDAKSLRPTYHLRIGVPGASNAIDIAARLGLRPELANRARRYLGRDRAEAEAATQRLEETQRELQEQTAHTSRERDEVEKLRRDYERQLARLQTQMESERENARREAEAVLQNAQREADAILRELRQAAREDKRESKQTETARQRLRTLRERTLSEKITPKVLAENAETESSPFAASEIADAPQIAPPSPASLDSARRGDLVQIKSLNREGELLEDPAGKKRVAVRVGAMRLQLPVRDLKMAAPEKANASASTFNAPGAAVSIRKGVSVNEEINLIGKNTDEALPELEKYLDDALLADLKQVRIIHGRGTGALRSAIHRWLKRQNYVREFALAPSDEGGEGATLVQLG